MIVLSAGVIWWVAYKTFYVNRRHRYRTGLVATIATMVALGAVILSQ